MAWAILACLGLIFVPLIGLVGAAGFWFLRIALPVMVVRWWIKFGGIKTADPDFPGAKRAAVITSVVAVFALLDAIVALIAALRR